jgi:hypothetical protein
MISRAVSSSRSGDRGGLWLGGLWLFEHHAARCGRSGHQARCHVVGCCHETSAERGQMHGVDASQFDEPIGGNWAECEPIATAG